MTAPDLWGELRAQARFTAGSMHQHLSAELQPRLAALLEESARVAILEASGLDATTQKLALEASWGNVAVTERNLVAIEARNLALRVTATVLRVALGAALG